MLRDSIEKQEYERRGYGWIEEKQKPLTVIEDIRSSLMKAAKLLTGQQQIKEEINNYYEDHTKYMKGCEARMTEGQTDAQYMFHRERQRAQDDGLNELHKLCMQQFRQNGEELRDWIQEKYIIAQDESSRSAKTVHSKWTRHQAFAAEIALNKDRLGEVQEQGKQLVQQKPELKALTEPKLVHNRIGKLEASYPEPWKLAKAEGNGMRDTSGASSTTQNNANPSEKGKTQANPQFEERSGSNMEKFIVVRSDMTKMSTPRAMDLYKGQRRAEVPPHLFAPSSVQHTPQS